VRRPGRSVKLSEIIDQGVTGAVVDTMEEAARMLPHVLALDRHAVRRRFEQRFSSARMATDYVALYRPLLKRPSMGLFARINRGNVLSLSELLGCVTSRRKGH
jgi:hypothetical protein